MRFRAVAIPKTTDPLNPEKIQQYHSSFKEDALDWVNKVFVDARPGTTFKVFERTEVEIHSVVVPEPPPKPEKGKEKK